jgi:hypothetical protein
MKNNDAPLCDKQTLSNIGELLIKLVVRFAKHKKNTKLHKICWEFLAKVTKNNYIVLLH